jgi:hypothetical protein
MYNTLCGRMARTATIELGRDTGVPAVEFHSRLIRPWLSWLVAPPRCLPHLVRTRFASQLRYLEQLRTGTSPLNAHHPALPPVPCMCGHRLETPRHFLLHCLLHRPLRVARFALLESAWQRLSTALGLSLTWQQVTADPDALMRVLLGNPPAPLASWPHSRQRNALEKENSAAHWRSWVLTLAEAIEAMFKHRGRLLRTAARP